MYRRPWDTREDEKLRALVTEHGTQQWALIASEMDGRNGKQCRERWHNQLDTNLSKDGWSEEEDRILLEGQNQHGNKWAEIAKMLPGRTDNSVKKPQSTAQGALQGGPPRDSPWSGFGSLWEYLGDYLGDNNMDEEERRLDEEEQRRRGGISEEPRTRMRAPRATAASWEGSHSPKMRCSPSSTRCETPSGRT